jgi:hypothetical protein
MISDGVKASEQGESIPVMDVAEILFSRLKH